MTFEIGVTEKESSGKSPFVEIGRRGNVRAGGDLNKRRIYDLSELFCAHKFDTVKDNYASSGLVKTHLWATFHMRAKYYCE